MASARPARRAGWRRSPPAPSGTRCSVSGRTIVRATPVYSWADTRSVGAVEALRARVDEKAYHARVGCRLHTSYLPARLWWLRERDPAAFRRMRRWVSFGEYLGLRLFGELRTSVSMASGTGLFDQWAQRWDPGILEVLGLGVEHLGPIVGLDQPFRGLRPEFAARWPALAGVPWLPALGDGACSNVGAGCTTAERAALMVGTSGAMRICLPADSGRDPGRPLVLPRRRPPPSSGRLPVEWREPLRVADRDPRPAPARARGGDAPGDGARRPRPDDAPVPGRGAEPRLGRRRAGRRRGPLAGDPTGRHRARRRSRPWRIASR